MIVFHCFTKLYRTQCLKYKCDEPTGCEWIFDARGGKGREGGVFPLRCTPPTNFVYGSGGRDRQSNICALSLSAARPTQVPLKRLPPFLPFSIFPQINRALPYCIFPRGKMAIGPGTIKFGEREREREREREEKEDGRNWASIRGTLFY